MEGELVFPYELRKGPATTRNAIVLMRIVGFPEAVVGEATEVAERLRSGSRPLVQHGG